VRERENEREGEKGRAMPFNKISNHRLRHSMGFTCGVLAVAVYAHIKNTSRTHPEQSIMPASLPGESRET